MGTKALVGIITQRIMELTAARSRGETRDLVVHHEIRGVSPEMIDWWWDNIDMRSTFRLPAKTPGWFVKGLKRHNAEEMARFSDFLPRLYEESTSSPPRGEQ